MTAPTSLPAEVQRIVRKLALGPSVLPGYSQAWISAAFDHGVIEVAGSGTDPNSFDWRTMYGLRKRPAVTS